MWTTWILGFDVTAQLTSCVGLNPLTQTFPQDYQITLVSLFSASITPLFWVWTQNQGAKQAPSNLNVVLSMQTDPIWGILPKILQLPSAEWDYPGNNVSSWPNHQLSVQFKSTENILFLNSYHNNKRQSCPKQPENMNHTGTINSKTE